MSFEASAREDALRKLLQQILSSEIDLIVGCRRLCQYRTEFDRLDDQLWTPIVGFESQTDHYPVGEVRSRCSEAYLKERDAESTRTTGATAGLPSSVRLRCHSD